MSNDSNEQISDDPSDPGNDLLPQPRSGRHAILPGKPLPPQDTMLPLRETYSARAPLPDLDVAGRISEDHPWRMDVTRKVFKDTEEAINALMSECHYYMREVAFRCTIQTSDANDRIHFMDSARSFAQQGAELAKEVARLRYAEHAICAVEPEEMLAMQKKRKQ
jgi:hypothetical protein